MTTINDDFGRNNADPLGTATVATVSQGWSWTEVLGDTDISSNLATNPTANTTAHNRAETDLASDAHYSQAVVASLEGSGDQARIITRYSGAADTGYHFIIRPDATSTYRLFKCVAGTLTQIGSSVNDTIASRPFTAKMESTAANAHTGYINGVSKVTTSDSSITGNVRAGFGSVRPVAGVSNVNIDDFEAADIAAAGGQPTIKRFGGVRFAMGRSIHPAVRVW